MTLCENIVDRENNANRVNDDSIKNTLHRDHDPHILQDIGLMKINTELALRMHYSPELNVYRIRDNIIDSFRIGDNWKNNLGLLKKHVIPAIRR